MPPTRWLETRAPRGMVASRHLLASQSGLSRPLQFLSSCFVPVRIALPSERLGRRADAREAKEVVFATATPRS